MNMNLRDKKMNSLLEKGSGFSRMELRRVDADGRSPLIHAVLRGNKSQVVAMIDAGAEVDVTDYNGDTALAHANRAGHSSIARLLVSKGADPGHKNFAGIEAGTPPSDTKDEARSDTADDASQTLTLQTSVEYAAGAGRQ
jgi:ankyrin repeat protein